jgi:hypothetical protein
MGSFKKLVGSPGEVYLNITKIMNLANVLEPLDYADYTVTLAQTVAPSGKSKHAAAPLAVTIMA